MIDFLAKLPPLLATLSKAFLVALKEQTLEVGRLFLRSAKWIWAVYYQGETQILGVCVDLVLLVVALRYFFLLLAIGVVLFYFEQWLLVVVYLLVLSFAAYRFFRIDRETAAQQAEYHKQSHDKFVRLLRWPLRALASVVLLYASWQFIEWRSLDGTFYWSHLNPAETRTVEEKLPTNDDAKKAGVAAYHAAKYAEAYRLLKPLAERGDVDAQLYVTFISENCKREWLRPLECPF